MTHIPASNRSTYRLALMTLVLLAAFALRVLALGGDSVWWDEGFSVWIARQPPGELFYQTAVDVHPPLYYLLLRGWRALAGEEEVALRLLSALLGLLAVAVIDRAGRTAGGGRAGIFAALLLAASPLAVRWSQEIRMHVLALLFAALVLWAALKLITGARRRWRWARVLGLATAGGLLTFYVFAGVVAIANLGLLIAVATRKRRGRLAGPWLASQAGALALVLPWLIYARGQMIVEAAQPIAADLGFITRLYLSVVLLGISENIERAGVLLVAAALIFIAAAIFAWRSARRVQLRAAWALLAFGAALPPVFIWILFSLPRAERFDNPTPSARYFLLFSPAAYLLLGWGLAALSRARQRAARLLAVAALAVPLIASGVRLAGYYQGLDLRDDAISAAAALAALRQPGDAVVLNNDQDWPIFAYHYPGDYTPITYTQTIRDDAYAASLLEPLSNAQGVWLVQTQYAPVTDPDNRLAKLLAARAEAVRRYDFPEAQLWFYALTEERAAPGTLDRVAGWPPGFEAISAPIADGVRLAGYALPTRTPRAGDLLTVGLGWHVETPLEGNPTVALKLIDRHGAEIASVLAELPSGAAGDHYLPVRLFVPADTLPGPADLVFVAGETWQTLGRVRLRPARPVEAVSIPPGAVELHVRFGEHITLLAAELPPQTAFAPGETVPVTLYWQADAPIPERYKVFVHVVGETPNTETNNFVWGQQDQEPGGGTHPTTGWRPGQVIVDSYAVQIREDSPPGAYTVQVGLYLPLDWRRLPATGADGTPLGDAVTLLEIAVGE